MSLSNHPRARFHELATLIDRVLEEQAVREDYVRLNTLLEGDPDACDFYLNATHLHAHLHRHFAPAPVRYEPAVEPSGNPLLVEVLEQERDAAARRAEQAERRERRNRAERAARRESLRLLASASEPVVPVRHVVIPKSLFYGGIAALVALMVTTAYLGLGGKQGGASTETTQVVEVSPAVARVTAAVRARWADEPAPVTAGQEMRAGVVNLERGVVELTFNRGAKLIIEAPSQLELLSVDRVVLRQGRLVGLVPPESLGFTVDAPGATVIDLGTEFGIAAVQPGICDVHVFAGKVALAAGDAQGPAYHRESIDAGDARQVTSAGAVQPIASDDYAFIRNEELEVLVRAANGSVYDRWLALSYRLRRDPTVLAYLPMQRSLTGGAFGGNLANAARSSPGTLTNVMPVEGQFRGKEALLLSMPGDGVRINIPGTFDQLSMAMWVRIDRAARGTITGLFLSDYPDTTHWQIDALGYMQLAGRVVPPLAPVDPLTPGPFARARGRWSHLAAVYDGPAGQVRFYLDGVPVQRLSAGPPLAVDRAMVGAWGPQGRAPGEGDHRTLQGAISEFVAFDRALTDDEVRELYEAGRP